MGCNLNEQEWFNGLLSNGTKWYSKKIALCYYWLDLQESECEVVGAHDSCFNAQVNILKNVMNAMNYLEF